MNWCNQKNFEKSRSDEKSLKPALYSRLKKRKVFKICPARFYEKLRKQFRDTQRVPFMLDETRKPIFTQLETKKSFGKCRIVPKNVERTFWDLLTYILLQNIKKVKGMQSKIFRKNPIVPKNTKIAKVGSLVCFRDSGRRFCFYDVLTFPGSFGLP